MPEQSPTFFIKDNKIYIQQCKIYDTQHMMKNYWANEEAGKYPKLKGKKNPLIETDLGITDMMKLADKDVKTVFINVFHMLKWRKHEHNEERNGRETL